MPRTACSCRAAGGSGSGGQPQFIEPLARAAVAVGVDGVFVEVHDEPEKALSDGANALRLDLLPDFWQAVRNMAAAVSKSNLLNRRNESKRIPPARVIIYNPEHQ